MKTQLVALSLFIASGTAQAGICKYSRDINRSISTEDVSILMVRAGAGSLEIEGNEGVDSIQVYAKLCASSEDGLAQMDVVSELGREKIRLETRFPEQSFFGRGDGQASIDLELIVPKRLALNVKDSSGAAEIENVQSLDMVDSSGRVDISDIHGDVYLTDSSGEINISEVSGSVELTDSSGSIDVDEIGKDFIVLSDSSGDIYAKGVGGDMVVKIDSSGSIEAKNVTGDFRVLKDSSGTIRHSSIGGRVDIPENKR